MFDIPEPELQVGFAQVLAEIRKAMLQDALRATIKDLDIPTIDRELAKFVSPHSLATLAALGLRGELVFPVPTILEANPFLVGYYRMLYGFSQKEFYKSKIAGKLKALETNGKLSANNLKLLPKFCTAMSQAGTLLLVGISAGKIDAGLLDDLTLLTLGTQLRGGTNVRIGSAAIAAVFTAIKDIVKHSIEKTELSHIEIRNAAGRKVLIETAPDPDIIIREELMAGYRHVIAIEVKGGSDFSNVHNRIGEAEKSHQKARGNGYTECWTVVNVNNINLAMAKRESPSTDRFYKMSGIVKASGPDYEDFRNRIISLTGIPSLQLKK